MNATTETISGLEHTGGVNMFRGLMWRHWLAGRWVIMGALVVLLGGGWALMLFHHPGWIITTGSIFAAISGMVFGGADAADGSEEFAFALPPTRSQRYLSGIVLGGGAVLAYCLIGALSIGLDLPQFVWSLVVDSGFTTPFGPRAETYLYFLATVIPLLMFACTFAGASLSRTRGGVWLSWLPAALITGLAIWLGCMAEELLWETINGYVCVLALLALGAMILLFGHTRYVRKEGISRPGRAGAGGGSWWIWIIVAVIVVFLLMMVTYRFAAEPSYEAPSSPSNAAPTTPRSRAPRAATPTTAQSAREQAARELAQRQQAEARTMAAQAKADAMIAETRARASHAHSTIAMSIPAAVLLVILLVIVLVLLRRRNAQAVRLRGPRKRHIVTRAVCAALAVAILASIGFFSWRETVAVYATESARPDSVRIPTKKAAALTAEIKPNLSVPLAEARLLINAVVLEAVTPTSFRAIRVDEFDIAWRSGKRSVVSNYCKLGGGMLNNRLDIDRVDVRRSGNSTEAGVQAYGNWNIRVNRANGGGHSSSGGEGTYITDGMALAQNIRTWNPYRNNKPLSVIPPVAEYGQLILCVFVDLADAGDKLTTIPVGKFITEKRKEILTRTGHQGGSSSSRRWRVDPSVPPTFNLMEHIGTSGLLLGLAAVLLAQLFMRRGLATVAMLATVVLYVAAIDRIALGMHMSHAQDTEASLSKRLIACQGAANTFFFARTASSQLRAIVDDRLSPDALQYRAGRNSILLAAIADTGEAADNPGTMMSTTSSMSLPAQAKDGLETLQWQITTYYMRANEKPVMVAVRALPGYLRHDELDSRMLWRVIFSQVDATGKIAVVGPSLRAVVTGNENDMVQAALALQRGGLAGSDVWTRLILPTARCLTGTQP